MYQAKYFWVTNLDNYCDKQRLSVMTASCLSYLATAICSY